MTLEVYTFGCRLNQYESEIIKAHGQSNGLQNTVILNSCAVTSAAEKDLVKTIRQIKRKNPEKQIIVTGCAAQINPKKYSAMPEISKVLGNYEKMEDDVYKNLYQNTEKVLVNNIMSIKDTASHMVKSFDSRTRGFIQVQNGCDHRCTFCIIPYGRGNSRSVPIGEIVKQCAMLLKQGYKEIVITGVDITSYGHDLPGKPSLGQMLRRLLALLPELPRLRLSSIDVAEIDHDLLEIIANEKRFMPHLHLSLQSGDNMILKRMKRRHTREKVIDFCTAVRRLRPEVVFGADIIAGFPTETEEMFQNTYNLLQQMNILYNHIFSYSERGGTPAARMPQLPHHVRKKRTRELIKLTEALKLKHYEGLVGREVQIIVEQNNVGRAQDFTLIKLHNIAKADVAIGNIVKVVPKALEKGQLIV